jgi:photosystem II stability/assembly factor-like uncharacterized protein
MLVCGFFVTAHAAWESIGPEGGYIRSTAVSATNGNLLYGATYYPSKIIKSTDGGETWDQVGSYGYYNYALAIDPTNDNTLYSASIYRVYKSTNGGVSWNYTTVSSVYVYDLEVHPTNPSIIYGAGRQYIASGNYGMAFIKSTNGGASWTVTTLVSGGYCYGWSVSCSQTNPDIVYVGGNGYGTSYEPKVFKSTNGGASFSQVYSGTTGYYIYSIAVHKSNPDIVCFGSYSNGIHRTTNGGTSWTKVASLNYNYRMRASDAAHDVFWASGYNCAYRSTNSGATWSNMSSGLTQGSYYGLSLNPDDANDVYLGGNAGFMKSTNSGSSWYESNNGILLAEIIGLGVAPSSPSTVFITFEDVAVYKTTNNGGTWTKCPSFSSCGDMIDFAVHNTDPNSVIALEGLG